MVRGQDGLPMPPPIGTEFFNDGELAELLNISCQERFVLTRVLKHKRTPPGLEDLSIAWQGAPPSSRLAVEAMAAAELMDHRNTKAAGDAPGPVEAGGAISATAPFVPFDVPVVSIDESRGPLPPPPPSPGDDDGGGGDDG
eukprot:15329346-Heterocapsa_arctica.AAC.1